jgi:hypothetical protein
MGFQMVCHEADGDVTGYHLGSALTLMGLAAWADTLNLVQFGHVRSFFMDGITVNSEALASELRQVFKSEPPVDMDLRRVIARLANLLADGHPDEIVAIED